MLFAVTMLLQTFFFDRLTVGVWFAPLIYTATVILLPINTPSIVVLLTGLLTGLAADVAGGVAGLNVIATLAMAYVRRPLLQAVCGRDMMREPAQPSPEIMGRSGFFRYALMMVALHAFIFRLFESLSFAHAGRMLLLFAAGTAESLAFLLITCSLFTVKNRGRL